MPPRLAPRTRHAHRELGVGIIRDRSKKGTLRRLNCLRACLVRAVAAVVVGLSGSFQTSLLTASCTTTTPLTTTTPTHLHTPQHKRRDASAVDGTVTGFHDRVGVGSECCAQDRAPGWPLVLAVLAVQIKSGVAVSHHHGGEKRRPPAVARQGQRRGAHAAPADDDNAAAGDWKFGGSSGGGRRR